MVTRAVKKYLKDAEWRRQHRWRKAIWNTMSRVGLTGWHGLPLNRRWVEIHWRKMPLAGLDPAMHGLKIVQISDIHYSPMVWRRYLLQYIEWINELRPDLVVVTGDLVTGGYRYSRKVAELLAGLKATHGVICTFGNHDYTMFGKDQSPRGKRMATSLEDNLLKHGLTVLRNQTFLWQVNGAEKPVAIVGLDDEWSGHIDPVAAWDGVDGNVPIVCLNHNPANVLELMAYPWQWMLSGHTHGRQIGKMKITRALLKKRFRHYTHGYYAVKGRHLYVNRGLSYGQRVQHWCRPEITVFKLVGDRPEMAVKEHVGMVELQTGEDGKRQG
jgi:predicted MPP superfamily phosphohydrolase